MLVTLAVPQVHILNKMSKEITLLLALKVLKLEITQYF